MSDPDPGALDTWPFWAPSHEASVAIALDLAGLRPGERLVDLGCGDGQVLVAAAERGVRVSGVEGDAALAEEAAANLHSAGIDADIVVGDVLDADVVPEADVYFTYLAPATLQRLAPVLAGRRGARLVTVDFAVPTLVPTRRSGPAHLYRLPGRRRPVRAAGWTSAGTLVSTVAGCQSLGCLELVHPAGPTSVGLAGGLPEVATALPGADTLSTTSHLAIDLRWEPMVPGTVVGGVVRTGAAGSHALFVIATEDEDEGMWELDDLMVAALRRALRRRQPPSTLAELLDATTR